MHALSRNHPASGVPASGIASVRPRPAPRRRRPRGGDETIRRIIRIRREIASGRYPERWKLEIASDRLIKVIASELAPLVPA